MSVRPITYSEQEQAYGDPFTGILMTFGATQGLLHHLSFNGCRINSNWFPNKVAYLTFGTFVFGGALAGAVTGIAVFGDSNLRRLMHSHRQDVQYETEARKF